MSKIVIALIGLIALIVIVSLIVGTGSLSYKVGRDLDRSVFESLFDAMFGLPTLLALAAGTLMLIGVATLLDIAL